MIIPVAHLQTEREIWISVLLPKKINADVLLVFIVYYLLHAIVIVLNNCNFSLDHIGMVVRRKFY